MKVICIDGGHWYSLENQVPGPETGEICTVEETYQRADGLCFSFIEYKHLNAQGAQAKYHSDFFRELTDDENKQEELLEEARELVQDPVLIEI